MAQPAATKKGLPDGDRIWIELEAHTDIEVCKRRASRLSDLLHVIGFKKDIIWWNETKSRYCITIDSGGGFLEMSDKGHWFYLSQIESLPMNLPKPKPVGLEENIGSTTP
jgi:hypothetical protein